MMMRRASSLAVGWLALLGDLSGCGLLSEVSKVTFTLPPQTVQFDSASLNLPAGNTVPIPCGGDQFVMDCCHPPAPLPEPDCKATPIICVADESGTNVCTARLTVSQSMKVDFSTVDPRLATAKSLANLSISSISYTVDNNTLNVDVPPFVLFLAPNGVTDPTKDQSARRFGMVPKISAGAMPMDKVQLDSDATATFADFTRDLSMPITLIATTTVDFPSGTPIPSGAIHITVTTKLSASL